MTEPESVAAEVIEDKDASSLAVTYRPSVIEGNFDALEAHVRRTVADYGGAEYDLTDAQAVRDAKRDRTYLNGLKKEIDERRKAVKREYNKPLDAFERRCKQITAIIDEAADGIKAQLDQAEEDRRNRAYAKLRERYEEFAGLLAQVVPYERIHDDKWLNKTFGEEKAYAALEEKVEGVARDWDTLKAQRGGMAHYEEAERELFRTLDLGAALTAARLADEEDARIAELKAAMEPEPEPEAAPESEPGYWPECVPPQPFADEQGSPAPQEASPAPAPCPAPCPVPDPQAERPRPWTVEVPSATRSQMQALAQALRGMGITGTIRPGAPARAAYRTEE